MHHKQNNKESKTYVQGLRSFGNTLPRSIRGILKKNGYNYSEIISKWNLLVGKNISNFCYPKSIKMARNNKIGTLILAGERGNEIDIEYSKKEIIDKINSYFGYNLIGEIRLETFSSFNKNKSGKGKYFLKSDTEKMTTQIKKIENTEIKDALYNLLKMMKK